MPGVEGTMKALSGGALQPELGKEDTGVHVLPGMRRQNLSWLSRVCA